MWNGWLTEALRTAWGWGEPAGPDLLPNDCALKTSSVPTSIIVHRVGFSAEAMQRRAMSQPDSEFVEQVEGESGIHLQAPGQDFAPW